jgi:hypothetical protein
MPEERTGLVTFKGNPLTLIRKVVEEPDYQAAIDAVNQLL